eukprot:TRINITY_DN18942_c2_g1_i1.p3 TRINITY_DN18942_c2_g1~~TRINITY_DN18942_c2_g1_i1.p3  ORF type:complete len:115 (+),score=15.34 TRINITY_DN18942_c2_g1_i1:138-482(+)
MKVKLQQQQNNKYNVKSLYESSEPKASWVPKGTTLTYEQWLNKKNNQKQIEGKQRSQKMRAKSRERREKKQKQEVENREREKMWPSRIVEPYPPGTFKPLNVLKTDNLRKVQTR